MEWTKVGIDIGESRIENQERCDARCKMQRERGACSHGIVEMMTSATQILGTLTQPYLRDRKP